jgi:hypothetical protein
MQPTPRADDSTTTRLTGRRPGREGLSGRTAAPRPPFRGDRRIRSTAAAEPGGPRRVRSPSHRFRSDGPLIGSSSSMPSAMLACDRRRRTRDDAVSTGGSAYLPLTGDRRNLAPTGISPTSRQPGPPTNRGRRRPRSNALRANPPGCAATASSRDRTTPPRRKPGGRSRRTGWVAVADSWRCIHEAFPAPALPTPERADELGALAAASGVTAVSDATDAAPVSAATHRGARLAAIHARRRAEERPRAERGRWPGAARPRQ